MLILLLLLLLVVRVDPKDEQLLLLLNTFNMFSKTKSANKKTPQIVKGMNKKKGASVTNVELSNLSQDKNCVICIGSSGSGKSTLISSTLDVDNVKQSNQSGLFEQYHNPSNSDEVWIETHIKWEENKLDTEQVCDDILDYLEKQVRVWRLVQDGFLLTLLDHSSRIFTS